MGRSHVELVRVASDELAWPLAWEVRKTSKPVGEAAVNALYSSLQDDLLAIDDENRFDGAVVRDEWVGVVKGVERAVEAHGLVFSYDGPATCGGKLLQMLTLACGGLVLEEETTAQRCEAEALDQFNKPTKGKFTRRVEWSMVEQADHRLELHLTPRQGFAVWLEKDKERVKAEREAAVLAESRPKSVKERLQALAYRPTSVKEAMQSVSAVAAQTMEGWLSSGSSSDGDDDDEEEEESARPEERGKSQRLSAAVDPIDSASVASHSDDGDAVGPGSESDGEAELSGGEAAATKRA